MVVSYNRQNMRDFADPFGVRNIPLVELLDRDLLQRYVDRVDRFRDHHIVVKALRYVSFTAPDQKDYDRACERLEELTTN